MATPIPTGVETEASVSPAPSGAEPTARHCLPFADRHLRLIQVVLQDQTDRHNELVHTREWLLHPAESPLALVGNLFVLQQPISDEGQVLIRRSPLPHAQAEPRQADLRVARRKDGTWEVELFTTSGEARADSPWVVLPYVGGILGRTRALHRWQQAQRPPTATHARPDFLVNTWGDRSRDSRVRHEFILREIEAAAALGADIVQIDDGWQKGRSANSTTAPGGRAGKALEGFWAQAEDFWTPDPDRFPQGLEPLVEAARARGVALGLWFAPDSDDDFANWTRDAEVLLGLHRAHGITHFKIDGIHLRGVAGHENLARFCAALRVGSEGRIVLDLDITAGLRPGCFGAVGVGPLFVENRYTDWVNYWPHQTLRTLWRLAPWVDPRRLRMEFLNSARNAGRYGDDPLAPSRYPADYLFATVMMACPLGWFEVSNLPAEAAEKIAGLVKVWRAERDALFAGTILPLGEEPDGVAWTGFVSLAEDGCSGYLLVFREFSEDAEAELRAPCALPAGAEVRVLGGEGELKVEAGGVCARVAATPGYVFARFGRASNSASSDNIETVS